METYPEHNSPAGMPTGLALDDPVISGLSTDWTQDSDAHSPPQGNSLEEYVANNYDDLVMLMLQDNVTTIKQQSDILITFPLPTVNR